MTTSINVYYNGQAAGGIKHWKLGIHDEDGSSDLCDIIGDPGNWTPRHKQQNPRNSSNYIGNTILCDLKDGYTKDHVLSIVQGINAGLNSKSSSYQCQSYVLEILDGCVNNGLIDANDPDYIEGREEVDGNFGK